MRIWGSMGMEIPMNVSMKVCQTDVNVLLGSISLYPIKMGPHENIDCK